MTYASIEEIESLVEAFQTHTLPRSHWTHQAHLIVALWYLIRYPLPEATEYIRQGIWEYNAAIGIQMTPTEGYHETLTRFWIHIVHRFVSNYSVNCLSPETVELLIRDWGDPNLPLQYYSRDCLMSWEARNTWIEPDLKSWLETGD
jgi:hypothetical protein